MANDHPNSTVCPSCGATASGKFCAQCGTSLLVGACRECGTVLPPGARFCNECGAAAGTGVAVATMGASEAGSAPMRAYGGPSAGGETRPILLPWGLAAAALVAVAAYAAGRSNDAPAASSATADAGAAPFAPFANGGGGGGAPPDLSSMTPRERASRLYDRVMRYAEQGKKDSLNVFAPMALASFEMLGAELDLDARYDYGRIATEAGQLDIAAAQADTILKSAPTHLLGLVLKARTATAKGDAATAAKAWQTFVAAKDVELKKNLPEYQMHTVDIEQASAAAKAAK